MLKRLHRYRDVCPSSVAVQQARNAFKKGSSPQDVAERLAELAVKRYTTDNVAVVIVLLGLSGQHGSSAGNSKSRGIFNVFRG